MLSDMEEFPDSSPAQLYAIAVFVGTEQVKLRVQMISLTVVDDCVECGNRRQERVMLVAVGP